MEDYQKTTKGVCFPTNKLRRHALREVAAVIGRIAQTEDRNGRYVGVEVNDGENTRCNVRAFIVVEHPR
ncbi:hypothetical protein JQ597_06150 [Bradyrhizobium sp. AUGA SZCCT0177]|uniref:hypothetical protein n=1 Tax=Bradyrhizobium sp. AUGA SZCCT0177 TaxID=2807665 RepID=UPI001BA9D604|nr:hypothetical protein [Bradyrhizobium sp. AUGA SZCCT0177]MBR1281613.1 hypothetical protein [Bradyrhizobium sp. AUGA SZCCT0177]